MVPSYFPHIPTYSHIFFHISHILSHISSWGHVRDFHQEIPGKFSKSLKSGGWGRGEGGSFAKYDFGV